MKKFNKAGLLIITLVIPALVFVFLRLFATNHYKVPVFYPLKERSGEVSVVGADTIYYHIDTQVSGDSSARLLKAAGWKGHLSVLSYLPENCNDTCNLVQAGLNRILALRAEIGELRLITITTADAAQSGRPASESRKDGWDYALFSPTAIDSVLYGDLKLGSNVEGGVVPERSLVLVDDQGRIRGYYDGSDNDEIERLMAEIKILDYERGLE